MKTITTKTVVYKFDELDKQQRQEAIENLYDINVDHDWWDGVYDDAANVGIKITSFDIDRGSYCNGDIYCILDTAEKIIEEHGEHCETHKTAADYLESRAELVKKHSDGKNLDIVAEDNEYDFDNECDDLDEEFKKSILEDYRIMLSNEYDYLTGKEAIIDTIQANDYDFTADGKLF